MKYKITKYSLLILNIAIVLFSFLFAAKIRPGTLRIIETYWRSFVPFAIVWIGSALWGQKYSLKDIKTGAEFIRRILKCNLLAILVVLLLMYVLGKFHYSRYIVFGTILGTFAIELFLFVGIFYAFRFHKENQSFASTKLITHSKALEESQSAKFFIDSAKAVPTINSSAYIPPFAPKIETDAILVPLFSRYLQENTELFDFINSFIDLAHFSEHEALVLKSETYYNIQNEAKSSKQIFINLHKVNDFRRINLYLIRVNEMLKPGGVFICKGQTIAQRRNSFYKHFTPYLGVFFYTVDFLFRRVMPKLPVIQGWYFAITNGRNRAFSETELLGRFYFCGFELIHKREIDGMMHFILKKGSEPRTDQDPTYGPLIRLKRKGKDGKTIYLKKLRTMHPYSEYLQHYVYQTNDLQEGGKFKDDFRITTWGRVLRKLWIDELPQFINFFKGELSLVGVRALSDHYFQLYPKDVQELRVKFKPGMLPPFYADMPKSFDEIVESERRYLLQKSERPFRTDWCYFWKGFWNIVIKHARSN